MAYEITKLVHGKEEADKVIESVNALFGSGSNIEHMPKADIEKAKVEGGVSVIDLLVEVGFMPSKSEARRMIQQNAVSVGGNKVTDVGATLTLDDFKDGYVIAQKGKKNFIKINLK